MAAGDWEQAARELSQWARLGRIEWNQQQDLLSYLRAMGMSIRPEDLPAVFGLPAGCRSIACAVRYYTVSLLTVAHVLNFLKSLHSAFVALCLVLALGCWEVLGDHDCFGRPSKESAKL